MNETDFLSRIKKFGVDKIIISPDTIIAALIFIIIGIYTNWNISNTLGTSIIDTILPIAATFFSIILAGLAIITSFTDEKFIYAWVQAKLYDDVVTLFQWNLYIPLILTAYALFLKFLFYNSILLILLIALTVYMIVSLIDLIKFISTYALQRADFIKKEFDKKEENKKN